MSEPDCSNYILCSACASIYLASQGGRLICTTCGLETDRFLYERLFEYSKTAAHYGYKYRKYYEKQVEDEGKIDTVASLSEPSMLMSFLGMAALSGIIGNVATDIVRKAVKTILAKLKELGMDKDQDNLADSAEMDVCPFHSTRTVVPFFSERCFSSSPSVALTL